MNRTYPRLGPDPEGKCYSPLNMASLCELASVLKKTKYSLRKKKMFSKQNILCSSQPNTNILPIDPTPLLKNGNSPTGIILAVAFLLWVLRPVMIQKRKHK